MIKAGTTILLTDYEKLPARTRTYLIIFNEIEASKKLI